jgi:hypothetical protein
LTLFCFSGFASVRSSLDFGRLDFAWRDDLGAFAKAVFLGEGFGVVFVFAAEVVVLGTGVAIGVGFGFGRSISLLA